MKEYCLTVDNSSARTFNTNIDRPCYYVSAVSEEEAVGKMVLSDWKFKHLEVKKIKCFNN